MPHRSFLSALRFFRPKGGKYDCNDLTIKSNQEVKK